MCIRDRGWTPLIMVTKAAENGVARPKLPRPYRTRSSANAEKPCEHTVSLIRVKCSINVRQIAFGKAYDLWVTLKVIQGHCRCCHLIGHIRLLLVFHCKCISILRRFLDINTYLPKNWDVTWPWPRPPGDNLSSQDQYFLSLIHIWRCRRIERCRSRWSPYH